MKMPISSAGKSEPLSIVVAVQRGLEAETRFKDEINGPSPMAQRHLTMSHSINCARLSGIQNEVVCLVLVHIEWARPL